jgi:hypothetical protein|nr:MAG TPA: hypothetical protein [Caudoviricetes sp.]
MPTETTVLHSSEETNPILDNLKEKLKAELKEAEKALVAANDKIAALGESPSEEDKAKAIDELTKAKAKVDDLKEKLKAAEGTHEDGEVTPSPVVPGDGAVESPTTGGSETTPTKPKEDEGHKPAPSTGGTETKPVSPTPGSEEGHGTTETHEGTPAGGETHTETPGPADHLEDHAAHAEEGTHEEKHEAKPSADEAALKAKAEEAKAKVETAKTDLEKAQAKVEELAKDEHTSEADKAAAAKALVEAKAKVEETTKEAAKAEAAANPANKLGGVAFALASGAYRML